MLARILIVDDHFAARTTIRSLLDWHSFQVCGDAKDGKEAIDKGVERNPDIVILDINMPVMDGLTAAREIRRISPSTKIVFLTDPRCSCDGTNYPIVGTRIRAQSRCRNRTDSDADSPRRSLWESS